MYDNDFEKAPESLESRGERIIPPEQDFEKNFAEGVPEFSGEQYGIANETNQMYGESSDAEEVDLGYNEGIADASALINYGLDAVAREKGVEFVVQGIKTFDASGSDNPIRDLYRHLGIDNPEALNDVRDESEASRGLRNSFKEEYNMPKSEERSRQGVLEAISDMKELISEVEGVDPRYEELRDAARKNHRGYFEQAIYEYGSVHDYGSRGLTELFAVLSEQKEPSLYEPELAEGQPNHEDSPSGQDESGQNGANRDETIQEEKAQDDEPKHLIRQSTYSNSPGFGSHRSEA